MRSLLAKSGQHGTWLFIWRVNYDLTALNKDLRSSSSKSFSKINKTKEKFFNEKCLQKNR